MNRRAAILQDPGDFGPTLISSGVILDSRKIAEALIDAWTS